MSLLIFILTLFLSALAKGATDDDDSDLILPPLLSATWSIYLTFAMTAGFQIYEAIHDLVRRTKKRPPILGQPEYTIGPIVSISLLLSALSLTIYYFLNVVGLALTKNEKVPPLNRPKLSQSYMAAVLVTDSLVDVLLIICILALLAHREKVLIEKPFPTVTRKTKLVCNTVLITTIFVLGMVWAGLRTTATTSADIQIASNFYLVYHCLLLVVAVYIEGSSAILYVRTRDSLVNDHKIIFLTTFIASPLFIIYALSSVILWNFNTVLSDEKTGLAHAVVASVVRYIIMATYLYLWVPPVHRHNKELRRGRPRSPCQS